MKRGIFIIGLLASAAPALAAQGVELTFPKGSVRSYEEVRPLASLELVVGPYRDGRITAEPVEGALSREVWKTPAITTETLGLLKPLREQLLQEGYKVIFECETRSCGGFDFRFNAGILDEPDMHVDLGDFRYLTAMRDDGKGEEYVNLVVSRSPERGFIQITRLSENTIDDLVAGEPRISVSTKQSAADDTLVPTGSIGDRLIEAGSLVLDGLQFAKGSATLDGASDESLRALAEFLNTNPGMKVALVGHTDASGSMEGNVALSRKRAAAVMKRLVEGYGVNPAQLSAEGVGYLAPRTTNATPQGREMNRRVEVVLTSIN